MEEGDLPEQFATHKSGTKLRWFSEEEISQHNSDEDCWVSVFGKVFDLSGLIKHDSEPLLKRPIRKHAGCDLSYWFDRKSNEVKTWISPESNLRVPYLPVGRFSHIPPDSPRTDWAADFTQEWWKDWTRVVGLKTKQSTNVTFVDTVTNSRNTLQVCSEESFEDILRYRFASVNQDFEQYEFLFQGRQLDPAKTLQQNGVLLREGSEDTPSITLRYKQAF